MSAIITHKERIYNAQKFIEGLGTTPPRSNNNVYLFIGHTLPWSNTDGSGATDNTPLFPTDTVSSHIKVWSNIIHLKRVNASDCSLVIPYYKWTQNIIYTQYDQDIDLFDPITTPIPFYVITDDLNVYKCLFNFNGSPSFIKPTGTSTNVIITGDGYMWKYMYTVSTSDAEKFLTNQWIPVKTLTISDNSQQWNVQQNAVPGVIDVIQILNPGFGYTVAPSVVISGDGSGAAAVATIKNGAISNIQVTNRGSNYTFATATVSSGQVTFINIINGGSGYISTPLVSITGGGGSGATATATILAGVVTGITITNPGTNYTSTPTVTIASSPGVQATASAVISGGVQLKVIIPPSGGHGSDPVGELGGFYAMLNAQFQFDESGKFTVTNDFRTVGLLLNPQLWNSTQISQLTTATMAYSLTLSSVTGTFNNDDLITGSISGATGVVLDYNVTPDVLRVVNVVGSFVPGENISNGTVSGVLQTSSGIAQAGGNLEITLSSHDSNRDGYYDNFSIKITSGTGAGQIRIIKSYTSSSKIAIINTNWTTLPDNTSHYSIANIGFPDLQPNTGYVLYIENRRPILRNSLQIESYSPVIEM